MRFIVLLCSFMFTYRSWGCEHIASIDHDKSDHLPLTSSRYLDLYECVIFLNANMHSLFPERPLRFLNFDMDANRFFYDGATSSFRLGTGALTNPPPNEENHDRKGVLFGRILANDITSRMKNIAGRGKYAVRREMITGAPA